MREGRLPTDTPRHQHLECGARPGLTVFISVPSIVGNGLHGAVHLPLQAPGVPSRFGEGDGQTLHPAQNQDHGSIMFQARH